MNIRLVSLAAVVFAVYTCVLGTGRAYAQAELREYPDAVYGLAAHNSLKLDFPAVDSDDGIALGTAFPEGLANLELLAVDWPGGATRFVLGIGQYSYGATKDRTGIDTRLAVRFGASNAQEIGLPAMMGQGRLLSRVCVWPIGKDEQAKLIMVLSFADYDEDSPIAVLEIHPDGQMKYLSATEARSLFGWFDCQDLNGDGTYELITSRNLDGSWGGFFYHSVRKFDPQRGYVAAPDEYHEYYREELRWLDWIVRTRSLIMADPGGFYSNQPNGPIYTAKYEGTFYAFDSIVEIPVYAGIQSLEEYNAKCRTAFERITSYQAELKAWLNGGSYPSIWNLR